METRFQIDKPSATKERGSGDNAHCLIYMDDQGQRLYWAALFPVPNVGDRVTITMNGIGPAVVVGYFEEGEYLGVMTKPINPPQWLKDQKRRESKSSSFASKPQWYKDGIGCEFGCEIKL